MTMSYVGMNTVGPVAPNNVSFGDALRRAGLNPLETTLGLPYMFLAPAGSDPDMQGVQVLVKGLQSILNRAGYRLAVDGTLGPDTAAALNRLSPPSGSYASKPWFQIYGDVLAKVAAGARAVSSRVVKVGALGDTPPATPSFWDNFVNQPGGSSVSPVLIAGGVFVGLMLLTGKR